MTNNRNRSRFAFRLAATPSTAPAAVTINDFEAVKIYPRGLVSIVRASIGSSNDMPNIGVLYMSVVRGLLFTLIFFAQGVIAALPETGFLNRSIAVDGVDYRYQVYVPREFLSGAGSLPVILALHGGGESGRDGLLQTEGGLARAIRRHIERFPAIVVFPQSPANGVPGFQQLGGKIAMAALNSAISEFKGDKSRIYLTGLSMGGNGSWYLAYHYPDTFAAMIVVCGFIQEMKFEVVFPAIVPSSDSAPYTVIAQKISRIPIRIYHGDEDPTVPVRESRRMTAALHEAGADVQYIELPGIGHNAWDITYDNAELFRWLLSQRRQ